MSWLLTDVTALKGTGYIEFQRGRYAGEHWRSDSVFFTEEVFAHVEPIVVRHRPDFNPYGPTTIVGSAWEPILADLSTTEELLASTPSPADVFGRVGFRTSEDKDAFARAFESNVAELRSTIAMLLRWVRQTLESGDAITILGL